MCVSVSCPHSLVLFPFDAGTREGNLMYVSFWPSQAAGLLAGSLLALLYRSPSPGWRSAVVLLLIGSAWVRTWALDEEPGRDQCAGATWTALETRWTWALDCLGWACLTVAQSGGGWAVGWLVAGVGVLCLPLLDEGPPGSAPALVGALTALLAGLLYGRRPTADRVAALCLWLSWVWWWSVYYYVAGRGRAAWGLAPACLQGWCLAGLLAEGRSAGRPLPPLYPCARGVAPAPALAGQVEEVSSGYKDEAPPAPHAGLPVVGLQRLASYV